MPLSQQDASDLLLESGEPLLLEHEFMGTGGADAGGSGHVSVAFVPPLSGSVLVGAAADVRVVLSDYPLGGAVAGGAGLQTFFDVVEPDGGVVVTPRAFNHLGYIGQGGAVAGGQAESIFSHIVVPTGGALAGATAPTGIGHTPTGGATTGGHSVVWVHFHPELVISILWVSGSADSGFYISEISDGGVIIIPTEAKSSLKLSWRRLRFFRFKIGDTVYVSDMFDGYIRQGVRAVYSYRKATVYELGNGWYPDAEILSTEQYLNWLQRRK